MSSTILYEDSWGEIIDRAEENFVEIRWYDTTETMTGDDFNNFLVEFACHVEQKKRAGALVDGIKFRMPPERMNMGWRDENIIPRYNAAGIKKFAFIMPTGMPAIGKEPQKEGPAQFPTGYFGSRESAVEWLSKS